MGKKESLENSTLGSRFSLHFWTNWAILHTFYTFQKKCGKSTHFEPLPYFFFHFEPLPYQLVVREEVLGQSVLMLASLAQ